jgi:hypothetical protein
VYRLTKPELMAHSEFSNLPFGLQIGLLLRDGVPLLSRRIRQGQCILYGFHTYFIEVGWDHACQVQFIRAFTQTDGLEPYLAQLDWQELASE